jgi:hypothetical protein
VKFSYEIGVTFSEGDSVETKEKFVELSRMSEADPEKHELFAQLLMLAARLEWRDVDRLRQLERKRR